MIGPCDRISSAQLTEGRCSCERVCVYCLLLIRDDVSIGEGSNLPGRT